MQRLTSGTLLVGLAAKLFTRRHSEGGRPLYFFLSQLSLLTPNSFSDNTYLLGECCQGVSVRSLLRGRIAQLLTSEGHRFGGTVSCDSCTGCTLVNGPAKDAHGAECGGLNRESV